MDHIGSHSRNIRGPAHPSDAAQLRAAATRRAGLNPSASPFVPTPPPVPPRSAPYRRPVTLAEYRRALATGDEVTLSHAVSQGMTEPYDDAEPYDARDPVVSSAGDDDPFEI